MHTQKNMTRRSALRAGGLLLANGLLLVGCSAQSGSEATSAATSADSASAADATSATSAQSATEATGEAVTVHVASLKGPTSIGLVSFMDQVKKGASTGAEGYTFAIATAADEIIPNVVKGEVDIALIPANAAAVLYGKTQGGVSVIDINTLGVLNVVTGDASIKSIADLADKTVYMTGKGATPEYAMGFLLTQAGIADTVTLEFKDEPTEVVSVLAADPNAVGVLPQPFATVATTKNEGLAIALDLTDAWDAAVSDGSQLITGVTVARKEFIEAHPDLVKAFVDGQTASVKAANDNPADVAPLVVEAGIIDNEAIAAKAIPGCHLVCITGDEMMAALSGYLKTLYDADPTSVGGELPADDFYYLG